MNVLNKTINFISDSSDIAIDVGNKSKKLISNISESLSKLQNTLNEIIIFKNSFSKVENAYGSTLDKINQLTKLINGPKEALVKLLNIVNGINNSKNDSNDKLKQLDEIISSLKMPLDQINYTNKELIVLSKSLFDNASNKIQYIDKLIFENKLILKDKISQRSSEENYKLLDKSLVLKNKIFEINKNIESYISSKNISGSQFVNSINDIKLEIGNDFLDLDIKAFLNDILNYEDFKTFNNYVKEISKSSAKSIFISILNTNASCSSFDTIYELKIIEKYSHYIEDDLLNEIFLRVSVDKQKTLLNNSSLVEKFSSVTLESVFKNYSISSDGNKPDVAKLILDKAIAKVAIEEIISSIELNQDFKYLQNIFKIAQNNHMEEYIVRILNFVIDNKNNNYCSDFIKFLNEDMSVENVQSLAKTLSREADIELNNEIYPFIKDKILPDQENFFHKSVIASSFINRDDLTKLNIDLIDLEHLVLGQNNCDTLIKMKDGNILRIAGHNSEDILQYIHEHSVTPIEERTKKFIAYFNPGHGYIGLESPEKVYQVGFSPKSDFETNDIDSSYGGAQYLRSAIAGLSLLVTTPISLALSSSFKLPAIISMTNAIITTVYASYTKDIYFLERKIGNIGDESQQLEKSKIDNFPKVEYLITDEEFSKIDSYIELMRKNCNEKNFDKCTYHFIEHNCVDFMTDVFNAGGYKGSVNSYLTDEQLSVADLSYSKKALLYVKVQDLLFQEENIVDFNDYI